MTAQAIQETDAPARTVLANARLVLPDEIVTGALVIEGETIVAIDQGGSVPPGAMDCEGDYLAPGLIELHTDNLERHMQPRPGVHWPHDAAIIAHDAELASVGITTVFDAMRIGSIVSAARSRYGKYARTMSRELLALRDRGALRISHFLHLRAEVCCETLEEEFAEFTPDDRVGLVSVMDHTPGQRQFVDVPQLRYYLRGKYSMTEEEMDTHIAFLGELSAKNGARHQKVAVERARALGAILASHDDTTPQHVAESAGMGIRLAEFPTTRAAAEACRAHGIAVMMGAPNVMRGGSHSGNVAASELAEAGLLDILSSDYVPASLLSAAVALGEVEGDMARALARVTSAPAAAAALGDRGRLETGLRADLVRISTAYPAPLTRGVWVRGNRVA